MNSAVYQKILEENIQPSTWGTRRCFLQPFPSLPGFKNGGFDFHERDTLKTHRVTLLTSQSVACSLLSSHFSTCSDRLEAWVSRY
uniref:Uncharacterized protein n=1 Tax=Oreochromis niloticus TaxID=8128 RepID=A0A669F071_ORENI